LQFYYNNAGGLYQEKHGAFLAAFYTRNYIIIRIIRIRHTRKQTRVTRVVLYLKWTSQPIKYDVQL